MLLDQWLCITKCSLPSASLSRHFFFFYLQLTFSVHRTIRIASLGLLSNYILRRVFSSTLIKLHTISIFVTMCCQYQKALRHRGECYGRYLFYYKFKTVLLFPSPLSHFRPVSSLFICFLSAFEYR